MIQWTGPKQGKLRKALIAIYPSVETLKRFVRDNFEHELNAIGGSNPENWAESLLENAAGEGEWINELYNKFCDLHQSNPKIIQLRNELQDPTLKVPIGGANATTAGEELFEEPIPYVGLEAFDQKTAKYFCGRASQIALLLRKIEKSQFVPVIGASGSGKSSLVKAGLMPKLANQDWCVLEIRPGRNPLELLKDALVRKFYKLPADIKEAYARLEAEGLNAILPEGSQRVLLVVDQFEELFTLCEDEQQRQNFIRLLVDGVDPEKRLTIATTMRADFVEQALHYPALAKSIQRDCVFWLVPLEPSEIREAIAEPAQMQGYEVAEDLREVICQDVEAEKNILPLLEFALTELWKRRDKQNHRLTLAAYLEIGKLRGALDRHAKQLYEEVLRSDEERDWAKRIFLKLVRTGQDVKDTRQRQPKQILLKMGELEADREAIAKVLDLFTGDQGRLLVANDDENNVAYVELAHESLMEGWEKLAEWRSQDRQVRRLVDRIGDAFKEWQAARDDDKDKFLLSEGVVAQIEEAEADVAYHLIISELKEFVNRSKYTYKPWLNPDSLPELVDIPGGTFWVGSPEGKGKDNEKPYHKVTVKAFRMGKYPVTWAQWRAVALSGMVDYDLIPTRGDLHPVERVSWLDAKAFCARLSQLTGKTYRLPSEAEWEYACRAGAKDYAEYYFGDDTSQLGDYAWYGNNSGDCVINADLVWQETGEDHDQYIKQLTRKYKNRTQNVGEKEPNAWGLYDMHGNVWEWCEDDWQDSYDGAPGDGRAWIDPDRNDASERLLRGGSWLNVAQECRSAARYRYVADSRLTYSFGFRVVCDAC